MILPYTKIIALPVFDLKNQSKVSVVKEIVFQKTDFKILGLLLVSSFFDRNHPSVTATDIVDVVNQGVIIKDDNSISNLSENIRLEKAVKEGYLGIGQKVVTKSGKSLGRVVDLYIETDSLSIVKILVKNIFSERIISSSAIVEIKKRKIIVKENFEAVRATSPIPSASVI